MVVNAEFDREFNWCADWYPGKPGDIEYILESGLDPAGQPQGGQGPSVSKKPEEETPESEECESGEGIECGCCCSEYVVVSLEYYKRGWNQANYCLYLLDHDDPMPRRPPVL
jgi:hypothetical protein